jgi:phosphoglycolate phosphatase-like HAD superfamily hydrolase
MINFSKYKVILWDFDGVLMDSMPVRDRGFEIVLSSYPRTEVEQLLVYHRKNGGLSRYVKFRYFFEELRKETISDDQVKALAQQFSEVMRRELLNKELLIDESVQFVKDYHQKLRMHIVSGSDEKELQFLCASLGLADYFLSIHGSPTPKQELVGNLMREAGYRSEDVVFIGDSMNDCEAASRHNINFVGYNNEALKHLGVGYIDSFKNVRLVN